MTNRYYKKFEIIKSEDDVEFYQPPSWIRTDFDDVKSREIVWQQGDRLDIIAEQLYGDPNLWKALALFNGIGYMFDIQPGQTISLPLKIKDLLDRL